MWNCPFIHLFWVSQMIHSFNQHRVDFWSFQLQWKLHKIAIEARSFCPLLHVKKAYLHPYVGSWGSSSVDQGHLEMGEMFSALPVGQLCSERRVWRACKPVFSLKAKVIQSPIAILRRWFNVLKSLLTCWACSCFLPVFFQNHKDAQQCRRKGMHGSIFTSAYTKYMYFMLQSTL